MSGDQSPDQAPLGGAPFAGFFERESLRVERRRYHRRIILWSVLLHITIFGALVAYSAWRIEELFGPSVEVRMFSRKNERKPVASKTGGAASDSRADQPPGQTNPRAGMIAPPGR